MDETPPFYQDVAIYIVPAEGGVAKRLTSESDQVNFSSIGWSPDGNWLAYFSRDYKATEWDGKLKVVSVEMGESRVVSEVENFHVNIELAWSPDSTRIALNGKESSIAIVSLEGGNTVNIETDLVDVNTYHLDWSPDGNTFAFCGYKGGDPELWLMEDFLHLVRRAE
jgi:Tol biopolymer transport system component